MRASEFVSEVKGHDFMAGHCHVMAMALKQLHPDWQIRAHVGYDDDAADDTEYRVDHVYTVAPDGTAYDCRGRFDNEQQLVGPDTTGGVDTQYVNFGSEEIKQAMLRGELKRFTKQDLANAMQVATQAGKQDVSEAPAGYKEIEFVCVNPQFPDATDPALQKKMYRGLKQIDGVVPLWQEWGDYSEGQASLSAIYQDSMSRDKILSLAKQLGVKVDLEQAVSDDYVDRAMRGEHEGQRGLAEGQNNLSYIGNCTDDDVIEHVFGDATGFAQAVEEYGDEFVLDDLVVKYDPETDVHSFYYQQQDVTEGSNHQHTEIIKHRVGDWIVYLDNHSVIRAMTRNIGPRMMSNLVTMVDMIPDLEDKVPKGGAFWIQDIKTNSSFYFKRLDIPSEPLAVRCETGVQDIPRANKQTPVFRVNAYTGPETKQAIQGMKQAKLRSKFVGTNTLANTLATNIQKGRIGGDDAIRNPATQDSKRYDTAFKQAQRMDKEVDENFADGRNPQDKGDAKRHGINTKASVSSLRKTAKQGGRKGQLAHWLANMKSGRAKKK
jgi:hypothetical protein